ncbi:MAG: bifunctional UDP-N-acetylglucosamine diphosphorylase/glucosamine-1-phosphate N-acetyltransferase GlmU, partial [Xanthomonadales bacterium]|nr:bifunctional UDP-N-acetylglucosamine diphosphorylase/glucosamine-1-phosphate N-acetyltransferase GlmU [Xanthomonadales bacterium]
MPSKPPHDPLHVPLHVVVLAAGEGTRMKSKRPKVLHALGGRPMLLHLLDAAAALEPATVHVVIGNGAEQVQAVCSDRAVRWVLQAERRGTGHALAQAMPDIPDEAAVLVLLGDHPLVPASLLQDLVTRSDTALAVLTMKLDDPTGYGRVVRDHDEEIAAVIEERDASPEQRAIREVNTGIILADAARLRRWLDGLGCDNAKSEYYLTDIFGLAHAERVAIRGLCAPDAGDVQGANDRRQLAALEARYRARRAAELMDAGVQLIDPARVDLRGRVEAGADVCIDVNVVLDGEVRLGEGVSIGPGSILKDCDLAPGTRVLAHCVLEGVSTTGPCDIGPFARLRPGTVLSEGCRIGNFVEAKNARLGPGSKASHLTYLGDTDIGSKVNI